MSLRHLFGLLFIALALVGCDQGRKAPPKTFVQIANVAPSFANLNFRRAESQQSADNATLSFKSSTGFAYDEDTYNFHIETQNIATGALERVHSFTKQVLSGTSYTFVFTEVGGLVQPVILESPDFPATAADTEIIGLHAAGGQPAMDFYIERPGTDIAGAVPWGSVAFLQSLAPRSFATGEYEITLTEAGNPANVLLASNTVTLVAGTSIVLVIVSEGGEGTEDLSLLVAGATSGLLYDKNAQSGLRVINGAVDTVARDVALNGEFSPPLFAAVPFATPTDYASIPSAADQPLNVTPVGSTGSLELDQLLSTAASRLYTVLFSGDAGTLTHVVSADDRRRVASVGKLQVFNAAKQFTGIDFFVVQTGGDITNYLPVASISAPGVSQVSNVPPGTYDLVLRHNGTTDIVAGPIPITVTGSGLFSVLAINGASSASADIVFFDDFP
jgi:hypothetical protein